jgi:hypothetical protein
LREKRFHERNIMTLAFFAVAGLVAGLFFNGYALIALCLGVALAEVLFSSAVGAWHSASSMILSLLLLQIGFLGGMSGSALLFPTKRASLPTRSQN